MLHQYIRAGKGFILVYAVNNRTSFDELKTKFYNTVMKYV
jgi:GTPase SAR1 family protein